MARALSKEGGWARHTAQSASPSRATANGRPQQAQPGPSRNVSVLQQAAQKPVSCTAPRQAMQSGGNKRSRTALTTFISIGISLMQMSHSLFDFYAQQRARNRARALGGERFLEKIAAEGLA